MRHCWNHRFVYHRRKGELEARMIQQSWQHRQYRMGNIQGYMLRVFIWGQKYNPSSLSSAVSMDEMDVFEIIMVQRRKFNYCWTKTRSNAHFSAIIATYFKKKIDDLKDVITGKLLGAIANPLGFDRMHIGDFLFDLEPVTLQEVEKLLSSMPLKSSPIDVVPTPLLKKCMDIFAPVIVRLANISFVEGKFPTSYTKAQVTPLLKKVSLDASSPVNYRPISNPILALYLRCSKDCSWPD